MSGYAVRNDGQGWRAVDGKDDVGVDEWYCLDNPPDPVSLPLTFKELEMKAKDDRDKLLAIAANRMGPLQDAVDTDNATADELEYLKLWKQYRIALNRIDKQDGFPQVIDWPVTPDGIPNL